MCLDEYVVSVIVEQRLRELREEAARIAWLEKLQPPLRVTVGHSLIRLGHWLAAPARVQPAT
jgi:hypothetical protein